MKSSVFALNHLKYAIAISFTGADPFPQKLIWKNHFFPFYCGDDS